jgi:hypothetical protein
VDVTSDTLFSRFRYKNVFTLTLTPSHIVPFALDAILPKIKNYTLLSSSDVGSTTVTNGISPFSSRFHTSPHLPRVMSFVFILLLAAKSYFATRNITFLGQQIVANNASDTSKLESDIKVALTSMNTSDLLVAVFYEPNFPRITSPFFRPSSLHSSFTLTQRRAHQWLHRFAEYCESSSVHDARVPQYSAQLLRDESRELLDWGVAIRLAYFRQLRSVGRIRRDVFRIRRAVQGVEQRRP